MRYQKLLHQKQDPVNPQGFRGAQVLGVSSPKIKRSSIFACRISATSWASFSEGLYFPLFKEDDCFPPNTHGFCEVFLCHRLAGTELFYSCLHCNILQILLFNIPSPEQICLVDRRGECKDKDGSHECILYTEFEHAKIIQPEKTEHEEKAGQPCIR